MNPGTITVLEAETNERYEPGSRAPLRIGIMLDSMTAPAWIDRILADIAASSHSRLCLVIMNCEKIAPPPPWRRLLRRRPYMLFKWYERFDRRIMPLSPDAHASVDLVQRLTGVPIVEVTPQRKGFTHRFADEDLRRIASHRLDVILRFGFNILRGDVLNAARFGVWSYHHGDNREYRGGPPMFWEMHHRRPVTGTILQILTEELDAGKVIYRSHASTDMVSYCRNRNQSYWKSAAFVTRRLEVLHRDGIEGLRRSETYGEPPARERPILRAPTNGVMCGFLARTAARIIRNQAEHHLFHVHWFLALRQGKIADGGEWELVHAPRGRFYADPFIVRDGDTHHVFFEDCSLGKADGVIGWFSIDAQGRRSEPQRVLEKPHHLSYPCVFRWDDDFYMIPETNANRSIELYRAEQFPTKWKLDRVLMSGVSAVDSTACFHEGRFWLMTAMSATGGSVNDELFLFHADSPHDTLKPHPGNPVVSDVRRARPAGTPFLRDGQLIRPGQDCSESYGRAISLSAINIWNTREYRESPAGRIEPGELGRCEGTHTINSAGAWTVADGRRLRLKLERVSHEQFERDCKINSASGQDLIDAATRRARDLHGGRRGEPGISRG